MARTGADGGRQRAVAAGAADADGAKERGGRARAPRRLGALVLPLLFAAAAALVAPAAATDIQACYARCAGEALGALFSFSSSSSQQQQRQPQRGVVCGADGRSYATGCLAACAGAAVASAGYCPGDRMRFAGAGLPLLPSSLLPFEGGRSGASEGEGAGRSDALAASSSSADRRDPANALAARMAMFAEEGFRYVGRTHLAPSVKRRRRPDEDATRIARIGGRTATASAAAATTGVVVGGGGPRNESGGGGAASNGSSSAAPAAPPPPSSTPAAAQGGGGGDQTVEVFRATPQGDLYVARYTVPREEARRAGGGDSPYRPADAREAREAWARRRAAAGGPGGESGDASPSGDSPAVAAAAMEPQLPANRQGGGRGSGSGSGSGGGGGGGGGGGDAAALTALLSTANGTTLSGGAGSFEDDMRVLDGIKWPLIDVSSCLNNGGGDDFTGGAAAGESGEKQQPTAAAPAHSRRRGLLAASSRRMLREAVGSPPSGIISRSITTTSATSSATTSSSASTSSSSPRRSLASVLGPDDRRRCPASSEPALPESMFAAAMDEARATLAAGGSVGKPANLTSSSGGFTRDAGARDGSSSSSSSSSSPSSSSSSSSSSSLSLSLSSSPSSSSSSGGAGANADAPSSSSSSSSPQRPPAAADAAIAARWPYSALGQLETRDDAGERVCTGALVGPDTVLTAAHCVWDDASYAFVAAPDFSPGRYRDGCRLVSPWGVVKWRHATIFRAYADTWEQDVAIIKLAAPVGWRTGWLGMKASCGADAGGSGQEAAAGGAGGAAAAKAKAKASSLPAPAVQAMSIAGYPLMPTRAGDGECLVATCGVRLREPDAGGQCPSDDAAQQPAPSDQQQQQQEQEQAAPPPPGSGAAPSAAAAAAASSSTPSPPQQEPLTAHGCDTAPGQSGAPLYDAGGYARGIHVLGISVGEPENGATTLTPWVMANVGRWVSHGGVPDGVPYAPSPSSSGASSSSSASSSSASSDAMRSLMDANGTLPIDNPEAWKTVS